MFIYKFIIHQIFLLMRDWSKRMMWPNIPQLGEYPRIFPYFLNCACCEKYMKDNKHNSLHLTLKISLDICPWTLSVPQGSQLSSSYALINCSLLRTDNDRGQISERIFMPNRDYCLYNQLLWSLLIMTLSWLVGCWYMHDYFMASAIHFWREEKGRLGQINISIDDSKNYFNLCM